MTTITILSWPEQETGEPVKHLVLGDSRMCVHCGKTTIHMVADNEDWTYTRGLETCDD